MMSKEQIFGLIRHGLTALGGVVITKGWMDEQTMVEATGVLMSVIGFIWSFWAKKDSSSTEEA